PVVDDHHVQAHLVPQANVVDAPHERSQVGLFIFGREDEEDAGHGRSTVTLARSRRSVSAAPGLGCTRARTSVAELYMPTSTVYVPGGKPVGRTRPCRSLISSPTRQVTVGRVAPAGSPSCWATTLLL